MTADASRYIDDAPISRPEDDRFGRWPFAERIAHVLATRVDAGSIVVGLYGPWGDGKTSVLNMMERALASHRDIACVRFNPWYWDGQASVVRSLFETVADHAAEGRESDLPTLLRRYGSTLSSAWQSDEIVTHSTFALDAMKRTLDAALLSSQRRTIVLVDDVDRLEPAGIQSLLKLVNLSASLATVSYVLAIDAEVVEKALGQRYGAGDIMAGRQFLEKIIQVPLHLPDAERADLEAACLDGVCIALRESGADLDTATRDEFRRKFSRGLVPGLRTPRQVKRYLNAIRFSVPLLQGEVHIVDQLLLEGLRVIYPHAYVTVRDHPEAFLGKGLPATQSSITDEASLAPILESCVSGLDEDARAGAFDVLKGLFPRLSSILGKTEYGPQWDLTWNAERRIASRDYFRRYFQYSVPVRDIGDGDVLRLVEDCNKGADVNVDQFFRRVRERDAWTVAFRKLSERSSELTRRGKECLLRGLAGATASIPRRAARSAADPRRQAVLLESSLLADTPADERLALATTLVTLTARLADVAALFSELIRVPGAAGAEGLIGPTLLGRVVANHIGQTLNAATSLADLDDGAEAVLVLWRDYTSLADVRQWLSNRLRMVPDAAIELLKAFCRGDGNDVQQVVDLDDNRYLAFTAFVDPEEAVASFHRLFPSLRPSVTLAEAYEHTGDARLAGRFIVLHRALNAGDR